MGIEDVRRRISECLSDPAVDSAVYARKLSESNEEDFDPRKRPALSVHTLLRLTSDLLRELAGCSIEPHFHAARGGFETVEITRLVSGLHFVPPGFRSESKVWRRYPVKAPLATILVDTQTSTPG